MELTDVLDDERPPQRVNLLVAAQHQLHQILPRELLPQVEQLRVGQGELAALWGSEELLEFSEIVDGGVVDEGVDEGDEGGVVEGVAGERHVSEGFSHFVGHEAKELVDADPCVNFLAHAAEAEKLGKHLFVGLHLVVHEHVLRDFGGGELYATLYLEQFATPLGLLGGVFFHHLPPRQEKEEAWAQRQRTEGLEAAHWEGSHRSYQLYIISMNITRLNFTRSLPHLLHTLRNAHFVALDLEMSGIVTDAHADPSQTDSLQTRYSKTKERISQYIPLQLGICACRFAENKIVYSPFNIYIYPLSLSEKDAQQFTFNSESMRFLSTNHFDFNKLFYEGVPFLNQSQRSKHQLRKANIQQEQTLREGQHMDSPDVRAFLNMNLERTATWIKEHSSPQPPSQLGADSQTEQYLLIEVRFVKSKVVKTLIKLLAKSFPTLGLKFQFLGSNMQALEDKEYLSRKYLKITIGGAQEAAQTVGSDSGEDVELSLEEESALLGQIWREIRVPLIVHNGYLDLMHTYHRFFQYLPSQELDYRSRLLKKFPRIYDTKFICNNSPVILEQLKRDTSLGNCYTFFRSLETDAASDSVSEIDEHCSEYSFDDKGHHEAGFDALMTCYSFVNAFKALGKPLTKVSAEGLAEGENFYANKIPLGNIRVPYCLEQDVDSYSAHSATKFWFDALFQVSEADKKSREQVEAELNREWDGVRVQWKEKGSRNFELSFVSAEAESSFRQKHLDSNRNGIFKTGNCQYVVREERSSHAQP